SLSADPADLASKDLFEPVIIADCGQDRCIGGKRYARKRSAIEIEPRDHLACDVLSIARAAAISGNQHLSTRSQAALDQRSDPSDGGNELDILLRLDNRVARRTKIPHHLFRRFVVHASAPPSDCRPTRPRDL